MSVVPLPLMSPTTGSYAPETGRATAWKPRDAVPYHTESGGLPEAYQNRSSTASPSKSPTSGPYVPDTGRVRLSKTPDAVPYHTWSG
jgi:hypothetical protein